MLTVILRSVAVALGLVAWFYSQSFFSKRKPVTKIHDAAHDFSTPLNQFFVSHPKAINAILIGSSAIVNLASIALIVRIATAPTLRPMLALFILYALRQSMQALTELPTPEGMIWRHPGFPSLLVTYGTEADFFFSGHTALIVLASIELAHVYGVAGAVVGIVCSLFEIATILVLRAHYTIDVYGAIMSAVFADQVAGWIVSSLPG